MNVTNYEFHLQVIAVIIVYLTLLVFLWKQENSFYFMILGQTLWIIFVAYGCSFLGALQVPIFLASLTYALVGIIFDFKSRSHRNVDNNTTIVQQIVNFLEVQVYTNVRTPSIVQKLVERSDEGPIETDTPKTKMHLNIKAKDYHTDESVKVKSQSEIYFKALFLACVSTILYKHVWMMFVAVVPISIYIANKIIIAFRIKETIASECTDLTAGLKV